MDWSDDAVANLRKLRAEGASMTQISRALGCTRSTIAGKVRRLGIPRGSKQPDAPKVLQIKAPTIPPPPPAPIVFADACEPVAMQALRYLGQCKWSVSDGLFCGREAEAVWCDAHKRVVFQPQKRAG